jgi:hypothetical protein
VWVLPNSSTKRHFSVLTFLDHPFFFVEADFGEMFSKFNQKYFLVMV